MDNLIFINEDELPKYKTTGSIRKREEGHTRPSSIPFNKFQFHNILIDSDKHLEEILEHIFKNKRRIYIIKNHRYEKPKILYYTTYDTFKKVNLDDTSNDYRELVQYYKYAYSRRKELRNDPITSIFWFNNETTGKHIYLNNVDLYNMLYTDEENYFIILDNIRTLLLGKNKEIFSDKEFVIPNINGGGNITRKIRLDDNNKKYFKFNNKKIYITGTPNTKKIGNITIRLLY